MPDAVPQDDINSSVPRCSNDVPRCSNDKEFHSLSAPEVKGIEIRQRCGLNLPCQGAVAYLSFAPQEVPAACHYFIIATVTCQRRSLFWDFLRKVSGNKTTKTSDHSELFCICVLWRRNWWGTCYMFWAFPPFMRPELRDSGCWGRSKLAQYCGLCLYFK